MQLHLKRPLAFFDLETTGTKVATDRIVEISIIKLMPNGKREIKTRRLNPEMPIPLEASLIHGIYDQDVENEPTFRQVGKSLADFLVNCDLAGYNSNRFDVPLLMEEFMRADIAFDLENRQLVDVQNIFHKMEQRTLVAAYKFYCAKDLSNAHSAQADTEATLEVLEAMIDKYNGVDFKDKEGNISQPIVNDIAALSSFSKMNNNLDLIGHIVENDKGEAVFNFGKHKGQLVGEVFSKNPSYYDWMMKGNFPQYTKRIITKLKLQSASNQGSISFKS